MSLKQAWELMTDSLDVVTLPVVDAKHKRLTGLIVTGDIATFLYGCLRTTVYSGRAQVPSIATSSRPWTAALVTGNEHGYFVPRARSWWRPADRRER